MASKNSVNAASDENRVRTLEADFYVVPSQHNRRIHGSIREISNIVETMKVSIPVKIGWSRGRSEFLV